MLCILLPHLASVDGQRPWLCLKQRHQCIIPPTKCATQLPRFSANLQTGSRQSTSSLRSADSRLLNTKGTFSDIAPVSRMPGKHFSNTGFNGDPIEEVGVSTSLFSLSTIEVLGSAVSDSCLSSNGIGIKRWVYLPKMSLVFLNTQIGVRSGSGTFDSMRTADRLISSSRKRHVSLLGKQYIRTIFTTKSRGSSLNPGVRCRLSRQRRGVESQFYLTRTPLSLRWIPGTNISGRDTGWRYVLPIWIRPYW